MILMYNRRKAVTLLELLVALSIVLLIVGGAALAFIELLRSNDRAQARIDANSNARVAIDVLSQEIKRAQNTTGTGTLVFEGDTYTTVALAGDRVDQDADDLRDEEALDGADDDNDWLVARDDRHAILTSGATVLVERPVFYKALDLDDDHVDIDLRKSECFLEFSTFDVPGEPIDRRLRFYIGTDTDGVGNALIREVSGLDPATSTIVTSKGPVAHNVVSFGMLFWDQVRAQDPTQNPWLTSWPSATSPPVTGSPPSVYMTITVYAGTPLSLDEVPVNQEMDTVTLTSVINVESVMASPAFRASKVPILPVTP